VKKVNLSLIVVFLTFIVIFMPTQQAFADQTVITTFTANDPDNAEETYNIGDTFTITFVPDTNQTGIMNDGGVDGNFTFAGPDISGTTFSGTWTSASTLVLTVDAAVGAPEIKKVSKLSGKKLDIVCYTIIASVLLFAVSGLILGSSVAPAFYWLTAPAVALVAGIIGAAAGSSGPHS